MEWKLLNDENKVESRRALAGLMEQGPRGASVGGWEVKLIWVRMGRDDGSC